MPTIRETILRHLDINARLGSHASRSYHEMEQIGDADIREPNLELLHPWIQDLKLRRQKYWRGLIRHTTYPEGTDISER